MNCPACKHAMIVVEYHRIELDYCPNCQGVWFDSDELDLWLKSAGRENERQFLEGIINQTETKTSEAVRRCPICRREMKKAVISKQPAVHIDVCPRGNGLWFDGGEVDVLLKELAGKAAGQGKAQPEVAAFLSEVFQARQQTDSYAK